MLCNILEQSLLFFPLALALYLSYVVLKTADLTTDGSFVIGAALFGVSVQAGLHPLLCMGFAAVGGAFCGGVASLLHTHLKLHPLIAGVLLVFILNTLSLKLLGRPNLGLLDSPSVFSMFDPQKITVLLILALILVVVVAGLLSSSHGLLLKALGNNPTAVNLFGKNSAAYRAFGLAFSNGLTGFSGALTAQVNGYVDISMGIGIVLIALGTVVMGRQIRKWMQFFRPFYNTLNLVCCFLGIVIYFSLMHLLLSMGLDPIYLRLAIGVCLISFLALTHRQQAGVAI